MPEQINSSGKYGPWTDASNSDTGKGSNSRSQDMYQSDSGGAQLTTRVTPGAPNTKEVAAYLNAHNNSDTSGHASTPGKQTVRGK